MLFLRLIFLLMGFVFLATAVGLALHDLCFSIELHRLLPWIRGSRVTMQSDQTLVQLPGVPLKRAEIRWAAIAPLAAIAVIWILAGDSIIVVQDGHAGVRISQISGVRPRTLYAGTHFIFPLFDRVAIFTIRDQVFSTSATEAPHEKAEALTVEAREGLSVGLAVTVRYRLDPKRLDYVQTNLPQPIDEQIVSPIVTSTFRELSANYVVRDLFSTKRGEFRERAAETISRRLNGDGIIVEEVLIRKVLLPEDYSKGLEDLLVKEEQNDQMSVEAEIEAKRVKIAESQAEALKIRQRKRAEGEAQSRVIMAKSESDSMQYTLPLKQKQIEQSRLEAEARKAATIRNAEADAQAKVIDSKAEQEREHLLTEAEANHIRVTGKAQAEQLELQAAALKESPLLVQYTVAQKLSDKVQIMLVPNDGKFFFTNEVLSRSLAQQDSPLKQHGKR